MSESLPTVEKDATLRDRIQEAATTAINSVYGTDDRHSYMGWRIAVNVVNGLPLPWTYGTPPGDRPCACGIAVVGTVTAHGADAVEHRAYPDDCRVLPPGEKDRS